ncbi:MAG: response regulator [Bacillaceae bacterium]
MIKIMIADDFQVLLEDLIELINAEPDMKVVETANSGKEIIEKAHCIEYDLILMDIEMEDATAGIRATEMIRDKNADAKVIFLTAHETKETILTAMGTGAVDYIVKGMSDEDILLHIRHAQMGRSLMERKVHDLMLQEYKRLQQSEKGLLFFIHNISNLTRVEKELIHYLLKNMKVKEIAKRRDVEIVTIKSQINSLLKKLGVSRTKEITKIINELKLNHLF